GARGERVSGDSSEVGPPVPIPNTVVKGLSADDTRGTSPRDNRPLPEALSPRPWSLSPTCRAPLGPRSRGRERTGSACAQTGRGTARFRVLRERLPSLRLNCG